MNRSLSIRIFLGGLVIVTGLIIFTYAHARASREADPVSNDEGRCDGGKSQSPFVLWESFTHNLLISNR